MDPGRDPEDASWSGRGSRTSCASSTSTDARAGGLLANGLAFAALFATFPLVLLILGIAGLVVVDPEAQQRLADALKASSRRWPTSSTRRDGRARANATAASVLGFVGVIWAVSQLYVTLDVAFSRIFADATRSGTSSGGPCAASCGSSSSSRLVVGVILLARRRHGHRGALPERAGVRRDPAVDPRWLAVPAALGIGLVFVIYRIVPPGTPSVRAIWLPAVIVGLAIVASASCSCSWHRCSSGRRPVGRVARDRVHRIGLAVVHVPGAAVRRSLGPGPRGAAARSRRATSRADGSALAAPATPAEPGVGRE